MGYKFSIRPFKSFVALYLAFSMGLNAVVLNSNDRLSTSAIFIASWLLMHAITGGVFLSSFRMKLSTFLVLLTFIFYVLLTTVAGPNFKSSLPYAIMLSGNMLFAYICVKRLTLAEFMDVLRRTIVVLVVASLIAFVLNVDKVNYIDAHQRLNVLGLDPIRGFFAHKVMASLFCGIGMLLVLDTKGIPFKKTILVLMLLFILLTGSTTGLILSAVLFAIRFVVNLALGLKISSKLFLGMLAFAALTTVSAAIRLGPTVLEWLNRDPTLTGRTLLWRWGIDVAAQKPIFGWGFGNYFTTNSAFEVGQTYMVFRNYDVPHFHQSFIQTMVDFGGLGVLGLCWMLVRAIDTHYTECLKFNDYPDRQVVQILLLCVFASTTMFLFFNYNHLVTILLMVFFLYTFDGRKRMKTNPSVQENG
ncbi:O-antigen ligase family protein [Celeribacter sp.]|uniref:O-antigen ligase family protein n=1 Tax=Celeribacter sp. TaxID=1890673 RepID=UPI003A90082C